MFTRSLLLIGLGAIATGCDHQVGEGDAAIPPEGQSTNNQPAEQADAVAAGFTRIDPTPDPEDPERVYIPTDLEDCFRELERMLLPEEVVRFAAMNEADIDWLAIHSLDVPLAFWIEDNWGLWDRDSRLAEWFMGQGLGNPDDMSYLIVASFWRHLNDKPTRFREQIEARQAAIVLQRELWLAEQAIERYYSDEPVIQPTVTFDPSELLERITEPRE